MKVLTLFGQIVKQHTIQEETARWLLRQAWPEPANIIG